MAGDLRILIADDHRRVREAISNLLSPEFDVVGEVTNGRDLLQYALALNPDVIVGDIAMPFVSGPQVMNELKSQGHDIPFVFVSGASLKVDDLILQGAMAIVDKMDMFSELAQAVRSAASRQIYVSRSARQPAS